MLAMRLKDEDWDAVIDTNLKAVFRVSRAVIIYCSALGLWAIALFSGCVQLKRRQRLQTV